MSSNPEMDDLLQQYVLDNVAPEDFSDMVSFAELFSDYAANVAVNGVILLMAGGDPIKVVGGVSLAGALKYRNILGIVDPAAMQKVDQYLRDHPMEEDEQE